MVKSRRDKLPHTIALQVRAIAEIKSPKSSSVTSASSLSVDVINYSDIEVGKKLASGSFCFIFEIHSVKKHKRNDIVIKKLIPEIEEDPHIFAGYAADLMCEGKFLSALSHPNIIRLHSWSAQDMVTDYINGSRDAAYLVLDRVDETLDDRLAKWKSKSPKSWHLPTMRKKQESKLLQDECDTILALAKGLEYLDRNRILHRALKPRNIGYTSEGKLKVLDFVGAVEVPYSVDPDTLFRLTKKIGVPRYMAPEVGRGEHYNLKADVYSFGLLVYQVLSLQKPYKEFHKADMKEQVYYGKIRPSIPTSWPLELHSLLQECWSRDISERPTMREARQALEKTVLRKVLAQKALERIESKEDPLPQNNVAATMA